MFSLQEGGGCPIAHSGIYLTPTREKESGIQLTLTVAVYRARQKRIQCRLCRPIEYRLSERAKKGGKRHSLRHEEGCTLNKLFDDYYRSLCHDRPILTQNYTL